MKYLSTYLLIYSSCGFRRVDIRLRLEGGEAGFAGHQFVMSGTFDFWER